jgi:hypothetical protein
MGKPKEKKAETIEAILAVKSNYKFGIIPTPIMRSKEITRLDACVWSVYFAHESMNTDGPVQLSQRQLAEWSGSDQKSVRRSITNLIKFGYLVETKAGRTTAARRGRRSFRTVIPERDRDRSQLKSGALNGVLIPKDDESIERPVDSSHEGDSPLNKRSEGESPGGRTALMGEGERPSRVGRTALMGEGERPSLGPHE